MSDESLLEEVKRLKMSLRDAFRRMGVLDAENRNLREQLAEARKPGPATRAMIAELKRPDGLGIDFGLMLDAFVAEWEA